MTTVTVAQIAEAMGIAKRSAERYARGENWQYSEQGRRRHYDFQNLPDNAQTALLDKFGLDLITPVAPNNDNDEEPFSYDPESLWQWAAGRSQKLRDRGAARTLLLTQVTHLVDLGRTFDDAASQVSGTEDVSAANLRNWYYGVNGKPGAKEYSPHDWAAALIPAYAGRSTTTDCSALAWEHFKALYLVLGGPSLTVCYRRTKRTAVANKWVWPSKRTIERRVKHDIPRPQLILLREGEDQFKKVLPSQQRDRSIFHALEAINGDGVTFKPTCIWPGGEIARPHVWFWQDLLSGKQLAWRADVSENKDMLRLAFGDMIEKYGIPKHIYLDNTRAAANKSTTGGAKTRYRYKVRDEDPIGIMPLMGCEVHFVTPAHGQAKPIERSFRDLRDLIDRHPLWNGRGTKDRPLPIEEFEAVLKDEISLYNAQTGRRSVVCAGRSFDDVFAESYERAPIRKATAEQRRLWMLAADKVTGRRPDGAVVLGKGPKGENRYWCEALSAYAGKKVIVRFDPGDLDLPVHAYRLDGQYIGEAISNVREGFKSTDEKRAFYRADTQRKKAMKKAADALTLMKAVEAARMIPPPDSPNDPPSKVVTANFRTSRTVEALNASSLDADQQDDAAFVERMKRIHAGWDKPKL